MLWHRPTVADRLHGLQDIKRVQLRVGSGVAEVRYQHSRRFNVTLRSQGNSAQLSFLYPWQGKGYIRTDDHSSQRAFADVHFTSRLRAFWSARPRPRYIVAGYGMHEKAMDRGRYREGVRGMLSFREQEAPDARLVWRETYPCSDAALLERGGDDEALQGLNSDANRVVLARSPASALLASVFRMAWTLYRDTHEVGDGVHVGTKRVSKEKEPGRTQQCEGPSAMLPCGHSYKGHVSLMATQIVLNGLCMHPAADVA